MRHDGEGLPCEKSCHDGLGCQSAILMLLGQQRLGPSLREVLLLHEHGVPCTSTPNKLQSGSSPVPRLHASYCTPTPPHPRVLCLRRAQNAQVCPPEPPECEEDEDCLERDDFGDPVKEHGNRKSDPCQKCVAGKCEEKVSAHGCVL